MTRRRPYLALIFYAFWAVLSFGQERTQLTDGPNAVGVLTPGVAAQNSLLVAPGYKEVTGSVTTATNLFSLDVSNYRWVSIHITSQGVSSTVNFEGSNDNTNWVNVRLTDTTSQYVAAVAATSGTNIFAGPINYRFLRARVTGISSGTTAVTAEFTTFLGFMTTYGVGTNLVQVGTNAVSTAASGVQKVGAVGNAGAAFDAPVAGSQPANLLQMGGQVTTAAPSYTNATQNALSLTLAGAVRSDISTIAGTAPSAAGKLDIKALDGDVFVRSTTAANFNATVVQSSGSNLHVNCDSGCGGGTQYADGTTSATPTGTAAMGQNDANVMRTLSVGDQGGLRLDNTIGYVAQKKTCSTGAGATTLACTFNGTVSPGNTLAASWCFGSNAAGSVTDNAGGGANTYALAGSTSATTLNCGVHWAANLNGTAGQFIQITVSGPGAGTAIAVTIYEINGTVISSSTPIDEAAPLALASGNLQLNTPNVGGAPSTRWATVLAIAPVGTAASASITPAAGWNTDSGQVAPTGGTLINFESQSAAYFSAGVLPEDATTPVATLSAANVNHNGYLAVFKVRVPASGISKGPRAQPELADPANVVALSPNNGGLPVNLIQIVQKKSQVSTGSVASINKAFDFKVADGNSIIVNFCNGNNNNPASPISDGVNSYVKVLTQTNASMECSQFYSTNVVGGSLTITVTPGGSNASIAMEIYEVKGLLVVLGSSSSGSQPDKSGSAGGSSGTASITNLGPVGTNEYVFATVGLGTAAQTITPTGTAWTNDSGQQNPTTPAGLFSFISMSRFVADPFSVGVSATFTSEPWLMVAASYRPVTVGVNGLVNIRGNAGVALDAAQAGTAPGQALVTGGVYNTQGNMPALATGTVSQSQVDTTGALAVNPEGRKATYRAAAVGFTAVAGIIGELTGSNTKITRVTGMEVSCSTSGTAGFTDLSVIKNNATDSGGTSTTQTATRLDSVFASATAVMKNYTAAPTAGSAEGTLFAYRFLNRSATVVGAEPFVWKAGERPGATAILLRATTDQLVIKLAAAVATETCDLAYEWTEE